ncbi:hypothetical protein AJ80_01713 [Polytolypa hystricis UAMH7299]|uniref:Uncharacterized protein n=1 Tax=Polytolypa hystricis (strain UAMH7299) TaxID=1447883 RepID=A0A2B7YRE7_POLH7|nr:hypothetical protein AJ80_01713 [Polytolypa hystricis UAMH7299]
MGLPSGPLTFDDSKVGTIKIPMVASSGYDLSPTELKKIFGIDAARFGSLPKRIVVPVLEGSWYTEQWYSVTGWLYILEPSAWVPQVSHGRTEAVSKFKKEYTKEVKSVSETKFNASTSASLEIEAGGSYMGITASLKSSNEIKFEVSKSTTVDETLKTSGKVGDVPVHELFVYPNLRCKVVKKQRIDYTINNSSEELKWTPDSYREGYWGERWVGDSNLGSLKKLAWHPVPMSGNGLAGKAYILPTPQNAANGDVEITTVMSRQGWKDWYHYDVPWQTATDQTITLAVPNNTIAFQPTGTWAVLQAYDRQIEDLMRMHVTHISKLEFLCAFREAFFSSMTEKNTQGGFAGAGLIPYNLAEGSFTARRPAANTNTSGNRP